MKKIFILLTCLMLNTSFYAQTERSKLAPAPLMGWMTWNYYGGNISEQLIKQVADLMVTEGYSDAGYNYIFIDDIWQGGRDAHNNIIPDPQKFPSGMKALADYVHSKGLKLGIYSDAAQLTCAGYTGSYGFEQQDARTFASWDIDYLKYDYCNAPAEMNAAKERYKTMADALSASGRDIILGVCEWGHLNPELWAHQAGGQQWRTSDDIRDKWKDEGVGGYGILDVIEKTAPISKYAHPGAWPDMDMLVVGLEGKGKSSSDLGGKGCTLDEYKSQMSLWSMFSSPLQISCNLTQIKSSMKDILLNKEIIAIDQDSLGKVAERKTSVNGIEVFVRPLSGNRKAIAILNTNDKPTRYSLSFKSIGINQKVSVRDVWQHRIVSNKANSWKGIIRPHATVVLVLQQKS
ncbi:MAG: glycoside hydrolase family 27 protein [Prevotella sp.]|jgi:alpha-galactosidase